MSIIATAPVLVACRLDAATTHTQLPAPALAHPAWCAREACSTGDGSFHHVREVAEVGAQHADQLDEPLTVEVVVESLDDVQGQDTPAQIRIGAHPTSGAFYGLEAEFTPEQALQLGQALVAAARLAGSR